MKKIILMAVAVLGALAINSCRKETETIIERVEVQKGNQILSGIGAPTETLGNVGDYYLDLSNSNLYGAKTAQGWGNPISLKGIQGDKGEKGDTGATGQKGDKGDTGATGQKGEKGDTGATGQKGEKGDTGATGQKGEKGNTGATGQKGDKGDTGTPGQNGSKIYAGIGAPTINIGAVGDWSIDSQNKRLYGPKEASGWSNEYISLFSSYTLSEDKKTLLQWNDMSYTSINMNDFKELKDVTIIGPEAFSGNKILTSIVIGNKVKRISNKAFENCKRLKFTTLPNGIERIGEYSFAGCISLESLTVPSSIISFATGTFENCPKLKTLIIEKQTPPTYRSFIGDNSSSYYVFESNLFTDNKTTNILVPLNSIETYKKTEDWKQYANKIQAIP